MKARDAIFCRKLLGWALGGAVLLPLQLLKAEYYSDLYEIPDYAPYILDKRVERENYNFKFGDLMVDLVGTMGVQWDDNINTSQVNPLQDWILQPGLSFGLKWQISEYNELDLNLGLEYWYYLQNDEFNKFDTQVLLTPETELSFRVQVGDVIFRVYDKLEYRFDSSEAVVIDPVTGAIIDRNPNTYTRYRNILGLQSEWFIEEFMFKAQVSRRDTYSPEPDFEYVNNHSYELALNVERALAANFMAGVGASYTTIEYDLDVNNNGDLVTAGPYIDWKLTEVIGLYVGLAWNRAKFDSTGLVSDPAFGDQSSYNDYTGTARLSHVINSDLSHQFELYKALESSLTSNFSLVRGARYSSAFRLNSRLMFDADVGYEEADDSGGLLNDDFHRWNAGVATELTLGPRLMCRLGYRYIDKNSRREFRSYVRNRVRVLFEYDF